MVNLPDDRSEIRKAPPQVSKEDRDTACNILMLHTDSDSAFSKRTQKPTYIKFQAFRIAGITSFGMPTFVERSNCCLGTPGLPSVERKKYVREYP
jgi:hypothetical protein